MRLVIESTDEVVKLDGVECRTWVGTDEDGRVYDLFVHRVGSADVYAQEKLAKELQTRQAPKEIA